MGMDASSPVPGSSAASGAVVSLRQVAEAAGVSRMTVSRAFRADSPMRAELRERVLAVARELGYEPDRMVTELMTSFVKRRPVKYRETLAALWWPERWQPQAAAGGFNGEIRRGIESGAARHGCGVEHVVLSARPSGAALTRMLLARGIHGLIITPPPTADALAPELNWNAFSAVCIGTTLREPRLHRAHVSHYTAMVLVLERLRKRGYRRPCLLLRHDLEERMRRAYAAAFTVWQEDGAERIWRAAGYESPGLIEWVRAHSPDVVIGDIDRWHDALSGHPAVRAFVSMDVETPDGLIAGHQQDTARIAEGAVDLLVQARLRHETGEPPSPLVMITTGRWVEGRSLPDGKSAGRTRKRRLVKKD